MDTIPIYQVPRVVLDTAIKAANLIGKGLYGVDLKMVDDKAYVIEINDNPSIDHELEDAIIGDEMYYRLLNHFEQALEMMGQGMLGIFVVLGVIALLVAVMQKIDNRDKSNRL